MCIVEDSKVKDKGLWSEIISKPIEKNDIESKKTLLNKRVVSKKSSRKGRSPQKSIRVKGISKLYKKTLKSVEEKAKKNFNFSFKMRKVTKINLDDINLDAVNFSQDSISSWTSTGMSVSTFISTIIKKGWNKEEPIHFVLMPDAKTLVSMDNRRLYALKKVPEEYRRGINFTAVIYNHNDKMDFGYWKSEVNKFNEKYNRERNYNNLDKQVKACTYGHFVYLRMLNGTCDELPKNTYGYDQLPDVREELYCY